jgi:hypothetical protein
MNTINKIIITTSLFIIMSTLVISCTKKAADCTALNTTIVNTKTAYTSNQSTDNCRAYKAALTAWLAENTCTDNATALKQQYTAQNAELKCQ